MGRLQRSGMQHGVHHVMNRGVDRGETFFDDRDRVEFGRLLGEASKRFGIVVHAYCLMSNHFHLLLGCPHGGLSSYMQFVASQYTRHTNDRIGRDGPLFRGRFHSIVVDQDDYLLRVTRYIHRNPLDLVGVDLPVTYRWSSHRAYLGIRRAPGWLGTDLVLDLFGHDIDAFDEFVSGSSIGRAVGISPDRMLSVVDLAIDEYSDGRTRSRQGMARTVAMLVASELDAGDQARLVQQLGCGDAIAQQRALRRARHRSTEHPELARIAARVLELAA